MAHRVVEPSCYFTCDIRNVERFPFRLIFFNVVDRRDPKTESSVLPMFVCGSFVCRTETGIGSWRVIANFGSECEERRDHCQRWLRKCARSAFDYCSLNLPFVESPYVNNSRRVRFRLSRWSYRKKRTWVRFRQRR